MRMTMRLPRKRGPSDSGPTTAAPQEKAAEVSADATYIVFADAQNVAERVAAEIQAQGATAVVASLPEMDSMSIPKQTTASVIEKCDEITGIIHCLSLDHSDNPC